MNRFFLISIVALILSSNVVAQSSSENNPENASSTGDASGMSRAARQGKLFGVNLGAGFAIFPLPGGQLHGFYQLKPDWDVGLSFGSGSLGLENSLSSTSGVEINEAKLSGNIIDIRSRYFLGNSFYLMGGLGQRVIEASFDFKAKSIDYGIKGTLKANTTVALFGLGNHWQWNNGFSLGCEWVGWAFAVSSSSTGSIDTYGTQAATVDSATQAGLDDLKKDAEDTAEKIGETSTTRLLVLSAGWTF